MLDVCGSAVSECCPLVLGCSEAASVTILVPWTVLLAAACGSCCENLLSLEGAALGRGRGMQVASDLAETGSPACVDEPATLVLVALVLAAAFTGGFVAGLASAPGFGAASAAWHDLVQMMLVKAIDQFQNSTVLCRPVSICCDDGALNNSAELGCFERLPCDWIASALLPAAAAALDAALPETSFASIRVCWIACTTFLKLVVLAM